MKVSLNTVKQYIDFELPAIDELVKRINAQLGGVEEVIDLSAKYKDAKIVHVVECEKHPNADRLNVCKIDAGTDELIQVVCGAPNVRADMWAVWLPPESVVPATYDDKEPFKLGARELRGVMSHGMLAAADELAIGADHEGILEINPDEWKPNNVDISPGVSFARVYGLDDTIIDIENKMFTHRPDCFGQLGVAREIAGILGHTFTSPDWYTKIPEFDLGEGLELEVLNDIPDKVPRFMAVAVKDIEVKPSPVWLQCALVALGSKPINNIVDVTNYVMLLTAQPTHAYDYDKLRGHTLCARLAHDGETAMLLNGKTYSLGETDIVITDSEGVVGLGGIMGGANSEVSADTKNIVLEVATFDMYTVRKSSMRHGVFTDALTRFNKGQSPLQNDHILQLLMNFDGMNGTQASKVFDSNPLIENREPVIESIQFINSRLGLNNSLDQITDLLKNVEMKVSNEDGPSHPSPGEDNYPVLIISPPFWRTDIELPEDIVEEVGRLYGFDKLPRELPKRNISAVRNNSRIDAKQRIRETLAKAGANEVLTYSLVHKDILSKSGQDPSQAFRLANALSPDLQNYRLSVTPSLIDKIHQNTKAGFDEFAIFEIGKAHHVEAFDDESLPVEFHRVAGVYTSTKRETGAPYYKVKRLVEYLINENQPGCRIDYIRLDRYDLPNFKPFIQTVAPFAPKRSAIVLIDDKLTGIVGELSRSVVKNFKLSPNTASFELFVSPFELTPKTSYAPLSKYPHVERDICFQVKSDLEHAQLLASITTALQTQPYNVDVKTLDIYQAPNTQTKNITFTFRIVSHSKTLTSEDASQALSAVVAHVTQETHAIVI